MSKNLLPNNHKKDEYIKKNLSFLNHLNFAIKTITRWKFPGGWINFVIKFQNGKCVRICALCSSEYLSDVGSHFFFRFSFNFFRTTKHIHYILEYMCCVWDGMNEKKTLRKITRNSFDGWKNPRKSVKQFFFLKIWPFVRYTVYSRPIQRICYLVAYISLAAIVNIH